MAYSDEEIIEIIEMILKGEGDDEQLGEWFANQLAPLMPGLSDLIFYPEEDLTPEEILKHARELSKPICL